jgi:hypothetical protein
MQLSKKLKYFFTAFVLFSFKLAVLAQDKKVDVDVNVGKKDNAQWYTNPVVWVIGAAVFILLLVALLRGRSRD